MLAEESSPVWASVCNRTQKLPSWMGRAGCETQTLFPSRHRPPGLEEGAKCGARQPLTCVVVPMTLVAFPKKLLVFCITQGFAGTSKNSSREPVPGPQLSAPTRPHFISNPSPWPPPSQRTRGVDGLQCRSWMAAASGSVMRYCRKPGKREKGRRSQSPSPWKELPHFLPSLMQSCSVSLSHSYPWLFSLVLHYLCLLLFYLFPVQLVPACCKHHHGGITGLS